MIEDFLVRITKPSKYIQSDIDALRKTIERGYTSDCSILVTRLTPPDDTFMEPVHDAEGRLIT